MSYESKIEAALSLIAEHNKVATNPIDPDSFVKCLKNSGATTDALLSEVMFEDLVNCCLPPILARKIAKDIFRKPSITEEAKPVFISEKRAAAMTLKELVERYSVDEFDNPVGKRLAQITQNNPCIAFGPSGEVLVEVSTKEVKALRDGFEPRESTTVNGLPVKLFRIGQKPDQFIDENPLYPGRPLRDGECDQTGRSWEGVTEEVKVLLNLAVTDTHDIRINQLKDAHDMIDLAMRSDAVNAIRSRFRNSSLRYDELKSLGKLPNLKLTKSSPKKQNPFGLNKTY